MAFEIVEAGPDDYPSVTEPVLAAFGASRATDEETEDGRLPHAARHNLAVREDGRWVAMTAAFPLELTVPGGATIATSGVTMVGVQPTHRRRGIASALMARILDHAEAEGRPVAILLAMESGIYGRFGYGVASRYVSVEIDAHRLAFDVPLDDPGTLTLHDAVEGSRLAAEVWDRYRVGRPGAVGRMDWMWEYHRRDRESQRHGASARFWVVHTDAEGTPDGFVSYRIKEADERGLPRYRAIAEDLVGTTTDVEAILLRYLAELDLVTTVEVPLRPVDDPLWWRLADPRQLQVTALSDFLWARVLDVPAAFSARTYGSADELVLEVDDRFRPASGGRFLVAGDRTSGRCERTDQAPDLTLSAQALGSLLLGTVPTSVLVAAGRVQGSAEAVARADAFFASNPAPFACTEF